MPVCERCGAADAIEKRGNTLCLSCWIEEIGRHRPSGMMERVREERRRYERTAHAAFSPAQRELVEFGGEA